MKIRIDKWRLIEELKKIEVLPVYKDAQPATELRARRYPFNRGLDSYYRKLPGLADNLGNGLRILDVGAGDCSALKEIALQYPEREYYATGIADQNPEGIRYSVAVGDQLPFPPDTFDLVMSVQALSWEPNQIGALNELIRVLKPGGTGLAYFTQFEYSIEHRFGPFMWATLGIDKADCLRFSHSATTEYEHAAVHTDMVPMKYPYNEYRYARYVRIEKDSDTGV